MIFKVLQFAIFLIPFATAIAFEPIIPYFTGDPRLAKEVLVNILLAGIASYGFFTGRTAPIKNKWILAASFYPVLTIPLLPPLVIPYGQFNIASIWVWKPMAQGFLFLMALQTLVTLFKNNETKRNIFETILWSGTLMSGLLIIQWLWLDQFFITRGIEEIGLPENANVTGTLGNSTLAGAMMAVCATIALGLGRWWHLPILSVGLLLTRSDLALLAGGISSLFLFFTAHNVTRKIKLAGVCLLLIIGCGLWGAALNAIAHPHSRCGVISQRVLADNGRYHHWADILKAWRDPIINQPIPADASPELKKYVEKNNKRIYTLTGWGGDAYKYLFLRQRKTGWREAHNEPLEIGLLNHGIIGLILYFGLFFSFIKFYDKKESRIALAVLICLFVLSLGTFAFHVEPFRVYALVMVAILL